MKSTYSVTEAQSRLPRILRDAEKGGPVAITRRNETIAFIVSRERMESIVETLRFLAQPEAMSAIEAYEKGAIPMHDSDALRDR